MAAQILLPIAAIYEGKKLTTIKVRPPTGGALADAHKAMEAGSPYEGLKLLISGCAESIEDITDNQAIRNVAGFIPYKSAELVLLNILKKSDETETWIEGVYPCPRCDGEVICENDEATGIDTRDLLSALPIQYLEGEEKISVSLSRPVEIKNVSGGIEETVASMKLDFPTLNHCSAAMMKRGKKDQIRLVMGIWLEALIEVNGKPVDNVWKNRFGSVVFEKMDRSDFRQIDDQAMKYGLQTDVKKICPKCGKEFVVSLNTTNFFASALAQ